MTGAPAIRPAAEADIPVLLDLLARLSAEIGYAAAFRATAGSLRAHGFGPRPLFRALIAGPPAAPLGLALFFPEFSTLRGAAGVYVQDLYLVPEARGAGLGRALLAAAAAAAARDWGAGYLRLTAHAGNAGALGFYAGLGFAADDAERPLTLEGAGFAALAAQEPR